MTAFVTQKLTQQNYKSEIARNVQLICMERIKVTVGDSAEFHRHLLVLVHSSSEKVKQLSRWW